MELIYFPSVLNLISLLRKLTPDLIKSNSTEHWVWGLRGPSQSHGYHHWSEALQHTPIVTCGFMMLIQSEISTTNISLLAIMLRYHLYTMHKILAKNSSNRTPTTWKRTWESLVTWLNGEMVEARLWAFSRLHAHTIVNAHATTSFGIWPSACLRNL